MWDGCEGGSCDGSGEPLSSPSSSEEGQGEGEDGSTVSGCCVKFAKWWWLLVSEVVKEEEGVEAGRDGAGQVWRFLGFDGERSALAPYLPRYLEKRWVLVGCCHAISGGCE